MKTILSVIALLGLVLCVYTETCPPQEDIYPCDCDEEDSDLMVDCGDETLTQEKFKKVLKALSGKKNVDMTLSNFPLGKLPANFFDGVGIKRLDISHCDLDSLSNDGQPGLLGLEDHLEELVILSSFTEAVPLKLRFGHLRKLKEIDLSYNAIDELGDDWFENAPPSLERLILSNNNIKKLGSRAFANLVNLDTLELHGNRFGPIKRSMLPNPALRLSKIELDNNDLSDIPQDIFTGMPSLTDISLRTNHITTLEENTWSPVWQQLDVIRLEGNPIRCDNRLNWILQQKRKRNLFGYCHDSKGMREGSLDDFIDSRS